VRHRDDSIDQASACHLVASHMTSKNNGFVIAEVLSGYRINFVNSVSFSFSAE
jgi:hypothetical protein